MVEKIDCRKVQVSAAVIMGTLAISTIGTALYLISVGHISSDMFFAGFSAGVLGSGTVASVGYCATRDCFFSNKNIKNGNDEVEFVERLSCKI